MCSITGMFCPRDLSAGEKLYLDIKMKSIVSAAAERGRTSWGALTIWRGGHKVIRRNGTPDQTMRPEDILITPNARIVIANNRAEPVTEVIEDKTELDIQPFPDNSEDWWVAHNGVVANDKDLAAKYKIVPVTPIDSAVLPALIGREVEAASSPGEAMDRVAHLLRSEVVGSYALAAASTKRPNELWLACNWRPLFIQRGPYGALFFASMPEYLMGGRDGLKDRLQMGPIIEIKPYSLVRITADPEGHFHIDERSLYRPRIGIKRKVLAVCSGGMDSVVTATMFARKGDDVTLLHYQYNCRAQAREEEAVRNVAKVLDANLIVVPTNIFSDVIKGNTLTDPNGRIILEQQGRVAAKDAKEWVPARNTIMTMLAVGIAEARDMEVVALGLNLEEAGSYPDNEQALFAKLGLALPNVVGAYKQVEIDAPLATLMKPEIVRAGMQIAAPLEFTWSCYNGDQLPCGRCGSCYHRRHAFRAARIMDPRFLHELHDPFWKGCEPYFRREW